MKLLLQQNIPRLDKVLLILSAFKEPQSVSEIKTQGRDLGFRQAAKWNISDILGKSEGKAISLSEGWELSLEGKSYLEGKGYLRRSLTIESALSLRNHLDSISNSNTKSFIDEAIKCHEQGLYRSAIIMSWLSAIDVLYDVVIRKHLAEFNAEAKRVNNNWKDAQNADDLGKMKESDFLDRLEGISVIGKNPKQQLIEALNLRNSCGHPNSLKIGAHKSAAHLETLLQNVFEVFL